MGVTLTPETQRLLEDKLRGSAYQSADEVVLAALEALNELENLELDDDTLDAIDRAEEQIARGEVHDWQSVREEIREEFLGR